jgi:hypothetical protein
MTNEETQLGRAKNAVLTFLENRLIVPKIYLDADWGGHRVDALAIERDGGGDVHAVLLFARKYSSDGRLDLAEQERTVTALMDRFQSIPANYKYIGAVDPKYIETPENGRWIAMFLIDSPERLISPDGIGRFGLLHINAAIEDEPEVQLRLKPERFRAKIAKLADEYIQQHEADWEIRT